MAKNDKKTDETALAVAEKITALAPIMDYGEDGAETLGLTKEDVALPFFGLLQGLSPLVMEGKANVGDFLNTATGQIYKREKGFWFVPSFREQKFAKWVPRSEGGGGGGFRGQLNPDDKIVLDIVAAAKKFGKYELVENGENLILRQTFYVYGAVSTDEPVRNQDGSWTGDFESFGCIPFWSTKIRSYKSWMARMQQYEGRVPMYAHLTHITSKMDKNDKGIFYVPQIATADPRGVQHSLLPMIDQRYQSAKNLKLMMAQNKVKVDYSKSQVSGDEDPTGDPGHPFGD